MEAAAQRLAGRPGVTVSPGRADQDLGAADGFMLVESDERDMQRQQAQFYGQFLVGRDGMVRWTYIEGARRGLEEIETLPDDELRAVARAL